MIRILAFVLAVLLVSPTVAQTQPAFAPITDRDLWEAMVQNLRELPASAGTHIRMQQILDGVQQEARMREARAKAAAEAERKKDEKSKDASPQ